MSTSRFGVEFRAELKGNTLSGHAAVFDQVADLGPWGLEALSRTAFDDALADDTTDVRALFNHDPNMLLGRQSTGTLRLGTDEEGLTFDVDLPDTSAGRDVAELARRGELTGASFGFVPGTDEWSKTSDGRRLRTHTSVKSLVDISPVTFPAYIGASVAMRSMNIDLPNRAKSQLVRARARVQKG